MRWTATLGLVLVALAGCAPRFDGAVPSLVAPHLLPGSIVARDGALIPVTQWSAATPRAVIVAAHGFNDYGNFIEQPADFFRRSGITTYALDLRSFGDWPKRGRWPGSAVLQSDLEDAVQAVAVAHPGLPLYVLGESMGGAVALAWAGEGRADPVRGLILVAPAVWGWQALNPLYKGTLWLAAHVRPSMHLTGRGLKIWPSDNIEMLRAYARDPRVIKETRVDALYGLVTLMDEGYAAGASVRLPTLVLYGARDQIVPKAPVHHVVRALGERARFAVYPQGYHMLLRDRAGPIVWGDIVRWIEDPAAPLASGAEVPAQARLAGREKP